MSSEQGTLNVYHSILASIVGEENLTYELGSKQVKQAISPGNLPKCVVYPQTQEQLAAVISEAYRNKWRVLPCGNGSKLKWGSLATDIDIVVSTQRLNKIINHAVGDLTLTVEAGVKFADIQTILAKHNQIFALNPTVPNLATIGGIIATGDTGSLRQRYGSVRDQLLGVTFVRADGQIARAGGRVVKNVAGYDLMKLFTGSYGTLSIITEATFRLYPMQSASGTAMLLGSKAAISQAADTIRGSALTPTQADLLSAQLVSSMGLGKELALVVRFESIAESVKEQLNQVLQIGEKLGLAKVTYSGEEEQSLWQRLPEQIHLAEPGAEITCKIGVLPNTAVEILDRAQLGLINISSGLGMLRIEDETRVLEMRKLCELHSGFLTILSAPIEVKQKLDVWGYSGNGLELMRAIKKQFDSENVLSPGRFVGGI
ncbi:FAD/FMN-dependent dehydrogenase [Rivularia sp. PCC 7116]|uniref:FAD-binding oxidoreductase n=1 Tax=Rivularia sp. PCC 7116 TaxID=373994 RepID=UPI00029EE12C|nr:FAD-binding oxidoreductase [Rivularia sp. PCC 7116]AFY54742.1 FAD/FMN-dependent dehydrogenase [Rivularia sp. PCC 7116]